MHCSKVPFEKLLFSTWISTRMWALLLFQFCHQSPIFWNPLNFSVCKWRGEVKKMTQKVEEFHNFLEQSIFWNVFGEESGKMTYIVCSKLQWMQWAVIYFFMQSELKPKRIITNFCPYVLNFECRYGSYVVHF